MKIVEKVFTKDNKKDIMRKKYNTSEVNLKLIHERDDLFMKNEVLYEVKKELKWNEKIIVSIFEKTFEKVFHIVRINITNKLLK